VSGIHERGWNIPDGRFMKLDANGEEENDESGKDEDAGISPKEWGAGMDLPRDNRPNQYKWIDPPKQKIPMRPNTPHINPNMTGVGPSDHAILQKGYQKKKAGSEVEQSIEDTWERLLK